jgi:Leucine-rich repeat (LRR) protein
LLAALTALTRLSLTYPESNVNVEALAGLTQLQDQTLSHVLKEDEEEEEDAWEDWRERLSSTLTSLVGLTRLDMMSTHLNSLEWCSALTNLRSLCAGGNFFESLDCLPNCPQLTELDLSNSDYLTSLSGLQGCPNLTSLNLGCCKSISSLEPLQGCPKLRELNLERCRAANLPGLEHLRGLPNLKITGS